jgi:hypothetical protein
VDLSKGLRPERIQHAAQAVWSGIVGTDDGRNLWHGKYCISLWKLSCTILRWTAELMRFSRFFCYLLLARAVERRWITLRSVRS